MFRNILTLLVFVFGFQTYTFADEENQRSSEIFKEVKRGFYSGINTGRVTFMGADRSLYKDGWLVGYQLGYEMNPYLAFETQFRFSTHESTPEGIASASIPRAFLVYQGLGFLKGMYPITRRFSMNLFVGGGTFYSTPNMKPNVGEAMRGVFTGGLGLQWFLRTRGLVVGLDPSLSAVTNMKSALLQTSAYIRYTF